MPDYKREPMFAKPTFPGYIPEGQEHKHPAMGNGDLLRGFVPEGKLAVDMDKEPDEAKKPGKKKA